MAGTLSRMLGITSNIVLHSSQTTYKLHTNYIQTTTYKLHKNYILFLDEIDTFQAFLTCKHLII